MTFVKSIIAGAAMAFAATAATAESVYYSEDTGSFYEVVYDTTTFAGAMAGAEGSTMTGVDGTVASGSLLTINNWAEFAYITDTFGTETPFWVGASDAASEGDWVWVSGDEAGEALDLATYGGMWVGGAPNNTFGTQDYAVLNQVDGLLYAMGGSKSFAYIIEYAGLPPVPLPGGLPLAAGAFGLLAFARKRRNKKA